jgi:hypothetical protein
MVDEALAETGSMQQRVRDLPARVVVYLLLAGCLFADMGYRQVFTRLTAGLVGHHRPAPTACALTQARRRVGVKPFRFLFDLLRGPAITGLSTVAGGQFWRGLLLCAVDGTVMTVADSAANLTVYSKQRNDARGNGGSSYPMLRLAALVACGTRTIIDAAFGPLRTGERELAARLWPSLRAGMLLLADRNFAVTPVLTGLAHTGADFLIRINFPGRGVPKLPLLRRLPDGTYLSTVAGVEVRVIDVDLIVTTTTARSTHAYRLITTLLDHHRHPARELAQLYHERWEIETTYLELKSSTLGGRVLRARTPAGIAQEVYALLITYQALRTAMTDATNTQPGTDPDRASFTIALNAARDLIIQAAGIIADTTIDLAGRIGRLVLANLLPSRRTRLTPRTVKRPTSKYGPNRTTNRTTHHATITINLANAPP